MKNSRNRKTASKRRVGSFAPLLRATAKKRPRGKPFPKGNTIGSRTRFQPGNSANPGGRPRCAEISRSYRAWLAELATREELAAHKLPLELAGRTHAEVVAYIRGDKALDGHLADAVELADRAEGKPRVTLGIEEDRDPLTAILAEVRGMSERLGPPENSPQREQEDE